VLYQISFDTAGTSHQGHSITSQKVCVSVGGVSENGMLPLVFFSVVGMGIGSIVSDCGFSINVQLNVMSFFQSWSQRILFFCSCTKNF
jgi:hypothetical protein